VTIQEMSTSKSLNQYASIVWTLKDLIEIRALPTKRKNGYHPESLWIFAEELPNLTDRLMEMNNAGLNIYAGVCPRKAEGSATDVETLPGSVLWTDFDHIEPREAWEHAIGVGMPRPTMAINSGNGCHLYWRLNNKAPLDELSTLVGDIAAHLGSDPSVKNLSRIMRLPGFMNLKDPCAPCKLLHAEPNTRYDFAELRDAVPRVRQEPSAVSIAGNNNLQKLSRSITHPSSESTSLIERGRKYAAKVQGATPGGRTNTAFRLAAALHNDLGLSESETLSVLTEWDMSANSHSISTDYGPDELPKIIRNTAKYHKNPPGALVDAKQPVTASQQSGIKIQLPSESPCSTLADEFEAEGLGLRKTIPFPWARLTDITRALRPGAVTIIAGPSGHGKSFFALQIAAHVHKNNEKFAYLILEDRKVDFERRLLAYLSDSWEVINDTQEGADYRKSILHQYEHELQELSTNVAENPRLPVKRSNGLPIIPPLPYQNVIDWAAEVMNSSRVIFIDPLAQIDFGERQEWKGQGDFMRQITGMAAHFGSSIILVTHTVKRGGRNGSLPLTGEDIQGAAEIKRLSHTILMLDVHDEKESEVWRGGGHRETVLHNKTVIVDKARNASGKGNRFAWTGII